MWKWKGLINGRFKMFPRTLAASDKLGWRWPRCDQVLTVKQLPSVLPSTQKVLGLFCHKSINIWLVVTTCFTAFCYYHDLHTLAIVRRATGRKYQPVMPVVLSVGAFLLPLSHYYHICPSKIVSRQMFIFCHWAGWGSERIRYGQILLLLQIMQIPQR